MSFEAQPHHRSTESRARADDAGERAMSSEFARRADEDPQVRPPDGTGFAEGLASPLYLAWRCQEECYRAQRYRRPLSLLVVELAEGPDSSRVELQLQNWLRSHVRMSDIAGYLGDRCYAVLLPETDREGAKGLETRLRWEFPRVRTGIGIHPDDGRNLEVLVDAARRASEHEG
jgi:hypothetical protein